MKIVLFISALSIQGFMLGCSKSETQTSNATTFTQVYNASFSVTCLNCHVPGASAYTAGTILDFSTADKAYNGLVGIAVQSIANPSQCLNVKRVVASLPAQSYLMGVLFSDYNTTNFAGVSPCQPPTSHLSLVSLSAAEKSSILSWINAGAGR